MIVHRKINEIKFAVNPSKAASLLCEKTIADVTKGSIYLFADYLFSVTNSYIPLITTWEITNTCNFNCKFCYINTKESKTKNYVPLSTAKRAIDELVEQGLLLVYLTGGEIFTHPNFIEIYTHLKEKGVFVILLTNLSLLDSEIIELLERYPPMRVTASLYGISEEQFINVTMNQKVHSHTVLDNILILKKMGINITVQTPINILTFPEYEKMAKWCYKYQIVYKTSNELTDSYFGENNQIMRINEESFANTKSKLEFINDENIILVNNKIDCDFGHKYHFDCISGKHTFAISYNLHVRPCFNIWEKDGPWFDGNDSMTKAILQLKEYIGDMKKKTIEYCNGCIGHSFCSECMMTQQKNGLYLQKYMETICAQNRIKAEKYLEKD